MVLAVVLENNVSTFYPGDTINGNVVVSKNIWHKVEGLTIRFLGKLEYGSAASAPIAPPQDSLPQPYQHDRSFFQRITRYGSIQEVVLDQKLNLLLSWKVLKPGSHEFPFTFNLPEELPESVKISGFRIAYEFVVVLRRPRDDYKVYQTPFHVMAKVREDESWTSEIFSIYSVSFELKTEDTIGFCFCCRSGPYAVLLRVPKRIGVVGQDLDFVMEIWNETRLTMDRAKLLLVREFKHKKGLASKRKEVVSELAGRTIPSGGHEIWTTFFRIPANTPPTNFTRRETYEISYILKALVHPVNQRNKSISVKCPILVIRPAELCSDLRGPEVQMTDGTVMEATSPPPTYAEAMMGKDNSSDSPLLE